MRNRSHQQSSKDGVVKIHGSFHTNRKERNGSNQCHHDHQTDDEDVDFDEKRFALFEVANLIFIVLIIGPGKPN